MANSPDGRRVVRPCGDIVADADAINGALVDVIELWNVDGGLVWLDEKGELVSVHGQVLRELARTHLVVKNLVTDGTRGRIELNPVVLDEAIMRVMLQGREIRHGRELPGGSLLARAPKAKTGAATPHRAA